MNHRHQPHPAPNPPTHWRQRCRSHWRCYFQRCCRFRLRCRSQRCCRCHHRDCYRRCRLRPRHRPMRRHQPPAWRAPPLRADRTRESPHRRPPREGSDRRRNSLHQYRRRPSRLHPRPDGQPRRPSDRWDRPPLLPSRLRHRMTPHRIRLPGVLPCHPAKRKSRYQPARCWRNRWKWKVFACLSCLLQPPSGRRPWNARQDRKTWRHRPTAREPGPGPRRAQLCEQPCGHRIRCALER